MRNLEIFIVRSERPDGEEVEREWWAESAAKADSQHVRVYPEEKLISIEKEGEVVVWA